MNAKDIRVLLSNCEHSYDGLFRVHLTEADYAALLAEVERLTAERDEALKLAYIGEHRFPDLTWKARFDELLAEVERMKGDRSEVNTAKLNDAFTEGTLKAGDAMRPLIVDAFQRGVAAMREAARMSFVDEAKKWQSEGDAEMEIRYLRLAGDIRSLPDPEDK